MDPEINIRHGLVDHEPVMSEAVNTVQTLYDPSEGANSPPSCVPIAGCIGGLLTAFEMHDLLVYDCHS